VKVEGLIQVHLDTGAINDNRVSICSSRPLQATRIFHGKTPEEVMTLVPMLYNICGNAQAQAAYTACMRARGRTLSDQEPLHHAREILVLSETAREHLYRILMDWPQYLGEEDNVSALQPVMQLPLEFKQALFASGTAFSETAQLDCQKKQCCELSATLHDLLARHVYAMPADEWLSMCDPTAFDHWCDNGATDAARLLRYIRLSSWEDLGNSPVAFLPQLDERELTRIFTGSGADAFIAQPDWDNQPRETTVLAREKAHPLLQSLLYEYGNSLLPRLYARLVELARIPSRIKMRIEQLDGIQQSITKTRLTDSGCGIGQVEAARGRLVHRVEVQDGLISRYQILAPTEWNFHPSGVVAKGISGLIANDRKTLRQQAELFINAVDPCVDYTFTVH